MQSVWADTRDSDIGTLRLSGRKVLGLYRKRSSPGFQRAPEVPVCQSVSDTALGLFVPDESEAYLSSAEVLAPCPAVVQETDADSRMR